MNRPSSTSNNSLRCDSATSEEFLELSSAPEPLRLLNRYRELCRIFRVHHANSFIVRLFLEKAWIEIQSQLGVIRHNNELRAKQQQLKQYKLQLQIEVQEKEKQEREKRKGGVVPSALHKNNTAPSEPATTTATASSAAHNNNQQQQKKTVKYSDDVQVVDANNNKKTNNASNFFEDSQRDDLDGANNDNTNNHEDQQKQMLSLFEIVTSLEQELSGTQILVYQPYKWRESFETFDLSNAYLGPRGIIAITALVAEMPWIKEYRLKNMSWFMCDEFAGDFCPKGEEVLRVVCLLLTGHPCLEVLNLDANLFATNSYVWLVDFCKKNASAMKLRKISVEDSLLEEFQKCHLQGILDRNVARRDKYARTETERLSTGTYTSHQAKEALMDKDRIGRMGFAESLVLAQASSVSDNNSNNMQVNLTAKEKMLMSHRQEKFEKSQIGLAQQQHQLQNNDIGKEKSDTSVNDKKILTSSILQSNENNKNNDSVAAPSESPKTSHLPSGPTSHRRGWNFLLHFCTHHPSFIRWSVLVARELCQTVLSISSTTGSLSSSVVPSTPSKQSTTNNNNNRNNNNKDKSPLSHSPSKKQHQHPEVSGKSNNNNNTSLLLSSSSSNTNGLIKSGAPSFNAQSMIYLMSGNGPSVLPGVREALIEHPFTTEHCRFQTNPLTHATLEAIFKCNPVLSLLDDAAKADVISRGRIIRRLSRSVIMETGDPCDFVYLILHGGLEIRGKPHVLSAAASPGAFLSSTNNNSQGPTPSNSRFAVLSPEASDVLVADEKNGSLRSSVAVAPGLQQYFASPSIFPAGSFVGGEEIMQPHITQNERRTATFVTTPTSVLPPVLCRRALIRQSLSTDETKADTILSNLPIVDACYDNARLLERANVELESITNANEKLTAMATANNNNNNMNNNNNNNNNSSSSANVVLSTAAMAAAAALREKIASSAVVDRHRGEKRFTIDDENEDLELSAETQTALRNGRLRELYGIQNLEVLKKIEATVHSNRMTQSSAPAVMNEKKTSSVAVTGNASSTPQTKQHQSSSLATNIANNEFKQDHDSVTVLFLVPRDVLVHKLLANMREQRRQWGPFLESLPAMISLPTHYKMSLADAIRRRQFTQGEIVGAGLNLYDALFVVVEGSASVYFQRTEIRRLSRGDIFACHPKSDVARISVVASSSSVTGNLATASAYQYLGGGASSSQNNNGSTNGQKKELSQLVIGTIAPTFAATLPIGLQRFLLRLRRVYSLSADPGIVQPDGS